MLVTAALITLGTVAYLNIGSWWARTSWKAWGKNQRTTAGFLCFPLSYLSHNIGINWHFGPLSIGGYYPDGADIYEKIMAVAWPLKALMNSITFVCFAGLKTIAKVCNLPKTISSLSVLLPKRIQKSQPRTTISKIGNRPVDVDEYHVQGASGGIGNHPDRKRFWLNQDGSRTNQTQQLILTRRRNPTRRLFYQQKGGFSVFSPCIIIGKMIKYSHLLYCHCEQSEAISWFACYQGDCHVATAPAMTINTLSKIYAHKLARADLYRRKQKFR